ncbi:cadherin-like protein 26 [Betta splendens]|uniref:Cadherin-like protein 26 n=1 Tax=Betta splendens TaxID=158456 RepID=A0A6P7MVY6_BETSP|nr:cadherin-like protein 26 [Betta splendens]
MRSVILLLLVAFAVLAEQHGGNKRLAKRELLLRSKRRWVLSTIELTEEDPGPYPKVISQMFNDKTGAVGENHKYTIGGMGVSEPPMGVFRINEATGVVEALQAIDREKYELFHIKFDILDRITNQKIDRELAFDIEIKDINDNPPKFLQPLINANVKENMPEGYLPVQLQAVDPDQKNTSNSKVTIKMVSQSPEEPKIGLKQLDSHMAQLTFGGCFNFDKIKKYKIIVMAHDHGTPVLSSSATINLHVLDSNTHPPMFKKKEYQAEVQESTTKNDLLRVAVEDKDTPNTASWRAKYFFIKGNEDGNYKIETDPETNEGVLSIIKGKDFERTTLTNVEIGVENEEALFVCKDGSPAEGSFKDSINVTVKVIDVNDPPQFEKEKVDIYRKEEEAPGKDLFVPNVKDVDSDVTKIRYVLLKDPADWVAVDKKTGKVTSTKRMDRESPFVDGNNVYQIIVGAIDNGEPPATGTCTVQIHLGDINDNVPKLTNSSLVMCGNKVNKVRVSARDADMHPFSGPFAFSLGNKDKFAAERWKLDPPYGEEAALVSLKPLPYGNYSVPLMIQDQQNVAGHDTVEMTVCDCGDGDICRSLNPRSVSPGPALIGLILASLLLFLLLLLLIKCYHGRGLASNSTMPDEGNQTLMKYNYEGGGASCMAEPILPTKAVDVTDSKMGAKTSQVQSTTRLETNTYSSAFSTMNNNMNTLGSQRYADTHKSRRGYSMNSTWGSSRMNTYMGAQGASSMYQRSSSLGPYNNIGDHIEKKMYNFDDRILEYAPQTYAHEGNGSGCHSLENIAASSQDNLQFLEHLGSKFNKLGGICHEAITQRQIQY